MDIISVDFNILDAQWITSTKRLAILNDRSTKITEEWVDKSAIGIASIYDVTELTDSLKTTYIGCTKEHISNQVEWAKNGNIFVVADTNNKNAAYQGIFHIYYIRTVITKVEVPQKDAGKQAGKGKKKAKPVFEEQREYVVDLLTTIEDQKADTIKWDPTSRFFITGKLSKGGISKTLNSFKIHDAKGDTLFSYSNAKLQQFSWRPRPYRFWSEEEEKAFKKEYKKTLRKSVVEKDESNKNEMLELFTIEKEKAKEHFLNLLRPLHQKYSETKNKRKAILKKAYPDSDSENEEEFERVVIIDKLAR